MRKIAITCSVVLAVLPLAVLAQQSFPFDRDVAPWTAVNGSVEWSPTDWTRGQWAWDFHPSTSSGSMIVRTTASPSGDAYVVGAQLCLPLHGHAGIEISAAQWWEPDMSFKTFDGPNCLGSVLTEERKRVGFSPSALLTLPAGARSLLAAIIANANTATTVHIDNVLFRSSAFDALEWYGFANIAWQSPSSAHVVNWMMTPDINRKRILTGPGSDWTLVGMGDLQHDLRADFIWQNKSTGDLLCQLFAGNSDDRGGAEQVATVRTIDVPVPGKGVQWSVVAMGDFQGDRKADLLWRNAATGESEVWLMDGPNVAATGTLPSMTGAGWSLRTGDFQGDGKCDILWHHTTTGESVLWIMTGLDPIVMPMSSGRPGDAWDLVAAEDFQSDGMADLLWRRREDSALLLWFMIGADVAATADLASESDGTWDILKVADFQGDGKADLFLRNRDTGETRVRLLDGPNHRRPAALPGVYGDWSVFVNP